MCRHCNEHVPFLEVPNGYRGTDANRRFAGLPWMNVVTLPKIEDSKEWADVKDYLSKILEQVYYDSGMRPPNHPMPAIRRVVEYMPVMDDRGARGMSIVVWEAPCNQVKLWIGDLSRPEMGVWGSFRTEDI